LRWCYKFRQSL